MQATDVRNVAVIGPGLMGHGIALNFAAHGYQVHLYGRSQQRLDQALQGVQGDLAMLEQLGQLSAEQASATLPRIRTGTSLEELTAEADLVIEAVSEDLTVKQQLFRTLDAVCPPRTILASTTSTLLPSALAAATTRGDRVLVTHYFNPPVLVPLVEVVRGPDTSDETVATVQNVLVEAGKRPALEQKEVPGFIGNRLQGALVREAFSLLEQGVATPADIDTVIKYSFGRRLGVAGVFEVADLAGLDTYLAAAQQGVLDPESARTAVAILGEKVERGELGAKSGQGFYTWTPETLAALRDRIGRALVELDRIT
jgi:3-hydroxybutyryl-CoA dehydrogenase